jgi:ribonuclease HII
MMFDTEKRQLGISFVGQQLKIGPVVGAMISVKPDFFRKFSFITLKPAKDLTATQLNKVVELTQKHVWDFKIVNIEPADFKTENLVNLELKMIMTMLNTQYRFWLQNVAINNPYPAFSDEEFVAGLKLHQATNLKKIDLKWEKWEIKHDWSKITMLANCYAEYQLRNTLTDLKSIWGDFGQGIEGDSKTEEFIKANSTCPAVRNREWM